VPLIKWEQNLPLEPSHTPDCPTYLWIPVSVPTVQQSSIYCLQEAALQRHAHNPRQIKTSVSLAEERSSQEHAHTKQQCMVHVNNSAWYVPASNTGGRGCVLQGFPRPRYATPGQSKAGTPTFLVPAVWLLCLLCASTNPAGHILLHPCMHACMHAHTHAVLSTSGCHNRVTI
jgi:hypothetical protein